MVKVNNFHGNFLWGGTLEANQVEGEYLEGKKGSLTGDVKKRYGFICVDRDNEGNGILRRIIKTNFHCYKNVITTNGEEL